MKVSFSRNHNGDPLVLVDGKVAAIAKECDGWDYVKAHSVAFSSDMQSLKDQLAASERNAARYRWWQQNIRWMEADEAGLAGIAFSCQLNLPDGEYTDAQMMNAIADYCIDAAIMDGDAEPAIDSELKRD